MLDVVDFALDPAQFLFDLRQGIVGITLDGSGLDLPLQQFILGPQPVELHPEGRKRCLGINERWIFVGRHEHNLSDETAAETGAAWI